MNRLLKTTLILSIGAVSLFAQGKGGSEVESHSDHMAKQSSSDHKAMEMKSPETKDSTKKSVINPQTTCPVMGGEIDKKLFVDHEGKRIYVCCQGCISEIKKNPAKYIKKLHSMGQSAAVIDTSKVKEKAQKVVAPKLVPQKTCPVMGGAINKELYVDYQGKRIYVCCGVCLDPIKKNPEKYLKKLTEIGEAPETI